MRRCLFGATLVGTPALAPLTGASTALGQVMPVAGSAAGATFVVTV